MNTDHIPISQATHCVMRVLEVPSIDDWSELCLDAVVREGAGPMAEAARLRMPLGHHPEVRHVMRYAANSRITFLKLLRKLLTADSFT